MADISLSAEPLSLVIEGFKGRGHALCDGPAVIGWLNPTFGEVPMRRVVDALRAYYANNQTVLDLDRVTAERDELAAVMRRAVATIEQCRAGFTGSCDSVIADARAVLAKVQP